MAFLSRHHKASHGEAFKNQNPARGRKQPLRQEQNLPTTATFKNQNPARGRKRYMLTASYADLTI